MRIRLLVAGLLARRTRPPLEALTAETDAERFLWTALPHAARSFAASIVVLPQAEARAAAVAYLYCRMLDTYEDLWPLVDERPDRLAEFAVRFDGDLRTPRPIPDTLAVDDRDRLHLLLVERCRLVDHVFLTLPERDQHRIGELVQAMAEGMTWAVAQFQGQGGVLAGDAELLRYCHEVIGHPASYAVELVTRAAPSPETKEDTRSVSELIQLANVTRDIEKDLARGIAYDPSLGTLLGTPRPDSVAVATVRRRLTALAMTRAPAYRRLFEAAGLQRRPGARMAAVIMLLFTDLHYRTMVERLGDAPWRGPRSKLGVVARALPAAFSYRAAARVVSVVTEAMTAAAPKVARAG